MHRHNIEALIAFLAALLRRDEEVLLGMLDPGAVWQGLEPEYVCHNAREVVDMFLSARGTDVDIETIELIGAPQHAILRVSWPDVEQTDSGFQDGIYNVFAFEQGRIARIDDYRRREDALAAAGVGESG